MTTIPASDFANVTPEVLPAAGIGVSMQGLVLTNGTRVPLNGTDNPVIQPFSNTAGVGAYFGLGSVEYQFASTYFLGFDNSDQKPASILFAQYNQSRVSAFLRGGNASALLTTLQGITSGNFEVIVDGFSWHSNSINLSAAGSLSAVASAIQADLTLPGSASVTGAISLPTSGAGGILTISVVSSGVVAIGQVVTGTGVVAGTYITGYGTGSGGTGTYTVNIAQTVASESLTMTQSAASFTASISGSTMTVTAVSSGDILPGMIVTGTGVASQSAVVSQLTGTIGGIGTYKVTPGHQTVGSESLTAQPANITVTYDSVSGGFIVTSGLVGSASIISYGTRTLATTMLMTQATGAVISQGAEAADPAGYMTAVAAQTQNWANFATTFDPDGGSGNAQKLLFAQWVNSTNNEFGYVALDSDVTPSNTVPDTVSLGYLCSSAGNNYSGVIPIWSPTYDITKAAFALAYAPCLAFTRTAGRATLKFKSQSGLTADVTNETTANNLRANGYNFYGVWATRAEQFAFFADGAISGPFDWVDSYENQIWLNDALQVAIASLMTSVKSLPYNDRGYSLVRAACQGPINAALNFGAIQPGINLSPLQIAEINQAAGNTTAAQTVIAQGYYLQVNDAPSATRQVRGSPPCTLWYADGESIQQINLLSIDVQ